MISEVRNRKAFQALDPDDVRAFLASLGWRQVGHDSPRADVWSIAKFGEPGDLLVPRSSALLDYGLRIAEVFVTLSRLLDRPQDELVRAVSHIGADIIRLRLPSYNEADASIRLRDGASLVNGALDLMSSAASAAVAPRAVLAPRRPAQAVDYMRRLELGQSERGSYVVSLISRVAPQLTPGIPGLLEILDEPFPRKVTRTLASALRATLDETVVAQAQGSVESFESRVEEGVSANLCDALGNILSSDDSASSLEVALSWANTRPVDESTPSAFAFTPDQAPVLHQAAAFLRSREPVESALLTGVVVDLHREPGNYDGDVSIATVIEGKIRKLRAGLSAENYQQALAAHDQKLPVLFRATLRKTGKFWRAEDVKDFRVTE